MKNVFLASCLFCFNVASSVFALGKTEISGLKIPHLGVFYDSVHIVWNGLPKKAFESSCADYVVFLDGKKLPQTARENAACQNKNVAGYSKSFYKYYTKKVTSQDMLKTDVTFYHITGLESEKSYTVKVCAVNSRGKIIASSKEISFTTEKKPSAVLNVTDFGAISSEKVNSDEDETLKDFILENTRSIQRAIDSCPVGGIVKIPYGLFMSGSLQLKSNMTLLIDGELCGSPFAEHYDFGFLMYPYYTDRRFFGLLNADGAENLRIIGSGLVDGNGWKFEGMDSYPSLSWRTYSEEGDPDYKKNDVLALVKFMKGNKKTVYENGILASSCAKTFAQMQGKTLNMEDDELLSGSYSSRSTLAILRNVDGLFISGLTFINPANHIINIIDSANISVTSINELSYDCNNGDGIGIICSSNVFIWNNLIDAGDDSIVFSAGVGKSAFESGEKGVEDVSIFGNYIHHGHGGVAFGSHTALGIKRVFVHDNIFNHTDTPFRVKSAPSNGGEVCDSAFFDNAIAFCKDAFSLSTDYSDAGTISKYGPAEKMAVFHDITLSNCTVYKARSNTIIVLAKEGGESHYGIVFENVSFTGCSPYAMKPKLINCTDIIIR